MPHPCLQVMGSGSNEEQQLLQLCDWQACFSQRAISLAPEVRTLPARLVKISQEIGGQEIGGSSQSRCLSLALVDSVSNSRTLEKGVPPCQEYLILKLKCVTKNNGMYY